VVLELTIHRLYCHSCHHREIEHIPFLSHPKPRLTKALERTILELRPHISIQALANFKKQEPYLPFKRKYVGHGIRYRNTDVIKFILSDDTPSWSNPLC
jgi:hypothetical protein